MSDRSQLVKYIVNYRKSLINIDMVREIWMIPDRLIGEKIVGSNSEKHFKVATRSKLYIGKMFVWGNFFHAIREWKRIDDRSDMPVYEVLAENTGIIFEESISQPLCVPTDTFILHNDDIENYSSISPIETTIGRYIANYLFIVYPFGNKIDYINDVITISLLEKIISNKLIHKEISLLDFKDKFVNSISLFGQSNEMICPNITEKTITVPPHIPKLLAKLVEENHDALVAGDSTVMSDIEKTVIKAYRDYLKGDPSMDFLLKAKYFNVVLKKLFLTQGMVELFGQPGKFKFISNAMGNGWKVEDLPYIFDEVRQGSYSRAVETADGGVIAKLILRVLQDTRINIPDCHTTMGEHIHATKDQLRDLLWNYVINSDGSETLIDEKSLPSFEGKDIVVRTPGYCQAPDGYCSRCFGYVFEELGQEAFAPIANDVGRQQTTASLKQMHGRSYDSVDLVNLNNYVI